MPDPEPNRHVPAAIEPAPWVIGPPRTLLATLDANPIAKGGLIALGEALRELDDRPRELATVRTGILRRCRYIVAAHTHIALSQGLTIDDLERIAIGPAAFEGHDAAVLALTDAIVARRPPRPETLRVLGEADTVAVIAVVGFYETIASYVRDAEPEADATPIPGLNAPLLAGAPAAAVGA